MVSQTQSAPAIRPDNGLPARISVQERSSAVATSIQEVSKLEDARLPGLSELSTEIHTRRLLATAEALESGIENTLSKEMLRATQSRKSLIKEKMDMFKAHRATYLPAIGCAIVPAVIGFFSGVIGVAATTHHQGASGSPIFFLAIPALPAIAFTLRTAAGFFYRAFLELNTPIKDLENNLEEPKREALRLSRDISKKADKIGKEKNYSIAERNEVFTLLIKRQVELLREAAKELSASPATIRRRLPSD